jgi:hypothetical protein
MGAGKNVLIGLDQTLNCVVKLCDGYGTPDEMLSARAWRLREQHPKLRLWIDRLFFWDKDHCGECYLIEMERKQLHSDYRSTAPAPPNR